MIKRLGKIALAIVESPCLIPFAMATFLVFLFEFSMPSLVLQSLVPYASNSVYKPVAEGLIKYEVQHSSVLLGGSRMGFTTVQTTCISSPNGVINKDSKPFSVLFVHDYKGNWKYHYLAMEHILEVVSLGTNDSIRLCTCDYLLNGQSGLVFGSHVAVESALETTQPDLIVAEGFGATTLLRVVERYGSDRQKTELMLVDCPGPYTPIFSQFLYPSLMSLVSWTDFENQNTQTLERLSSLENYQVSLSCRNASQFDVDVSSFPSTSRIRDDRKRGCQTFLKN
jgi:hypothetical protein